jgi:energy-converting hydrogenase A subunit M
MTLSKNDVLLNLGWIKGIIDMGIKEDDQEIKDEVAEVVDDIREYLETIK